MAFNLRKLLEDGVRTANQLSDKYNPFDTDFQKNNVVKPLSQGVNNLFNKPVQQTPQRITPDVFRGVREPLIDKIKGTELKGAGQIAGMFGQNRKVNVGDVGNGIKSGVNDIVVKPFVDATSAASLIPEFVGRAAYGAGRELGGDRGGFVDEIAKKPYYAEKHFGGKFEGDGSLKSTLSSGFNRKVIGQAASLPTYFYAGAKGLGNIEGNLASRVLHRTTSVIPEAVLNTGLQQFEQGNMDNVGQNLATNVGTMAAFSNLTGGLGDIKRYMQGGGNIPVGLSVEDVSGKKPKPDHLTDTSKMVSQPTIGAKGNGGLTNREIRQGIDDGLLDLNTPFNPRTNGGGIGQPPIKPPVARGKMPDETPFGFNESAKGSEFVSPEAKTKLEGGAPVRHNTELQNTVAAKLSEMDPVKAHDFALKTNSDEGTTAAIQLAQQYRKQGNFDLEAEIINAKAARLREAGKEIQAARLVDELSPEGVVANAAQVIQRYNEKARKPIAELTGDLAKKFSDEADRIGQMAEGREKNLAMYKMKEDLLNLVPSSASDKAIAVWKAGLLTSLRTHERNIIGNSIMLGAETIKDLPASLADRIMSGKTGQRTLTATMKGLEEFGSKKTRQEIADLVIHGVDLSDDISKYNMQHITWDPNSKIQQGLKKYTDAVFRTLGAEDRAFYNAAYARSLYDQAGAMAKNAKNTDVGFIKNLVDNPTEDMLVAATKDANYATFHDKNMISNAATGIKKAMSTDKFGKVPGEAGKVLSEVVAPFTGVPSSIATKTIAYSPIGLVKGAVDVGRVIKGSEVAGLQRQAAQEIGRGVVGTGLFGLGAYLMGKGLMTGQPKDKKEADLWAAQGKQQNSILVGGKWRSINSVGPQTLVMLAGAKLQEEMNRPDGNIGAYMGKLGKDQLSQTFLAGVQGPLNAVTDPARYGQSYLGGQLSSTVPNIIKDWSKAADDKLRENNNIGDYFKNSIPYWRNTSTVKRDVLGQEMPQEPTGGWAFVDLFNSKTPVNNPVANELGRLYQVGQEATPAAVDKGSMKTLGIDNLNPKQLDELEKRSGGYLMSNLTDIVQSPVYQNGTDEEKKNAIKSVVDKAKETAKYDMALGVPATGSTAGTTSGMANTSNMKSKAVTDLNKQAFDRSGKNYEEKDGMVYRRGTDGNITVVTKTRYNYDLTKQELERYKKREDLGGWMKAAQKQAGHLDEMLKDQSLDPEERMKLENDYDDLATLVSKYSSYGGFKKGSSGASKKKKETAKIASLMSERNKITSGTFNDLQSLLSGVRPKKPQSLGRKVSLRKGF